MLFSLNVVRRLFHVALFVLPCFALLRALATPLALAETGREAVQTPVAASPTTAQKVSTPVSTTVRTAATATAVLAATATVTATEAVPTSTQTFNEWFTSVFNGITGDLKSLGEALLALGGVITIISGAVTWLRDRGKKDKKDTSATDSSITPAPAPPSS